MRNVPSVASSRVVGDVRCNTMWKKLTLATKETQNQGWLCCTCLRDGLTFNLKKYSLLRNELRADVFVLRFVIMQSDDNDSVKSRLSRIRIFTKLSYLFYVCKTRYLNKSRSTRV